MNRTPVNSSNIHSIGHDETGLEVQFHAKGCELRSSSATDAKDPSCTCEGGDCYHYPGVPAELHQQLMAAKSVGAHFMKNVRGAAHPQTGALLYPGVKRES